MDKKFSRIRNIILPNKKINYTILGVLLIGIISGSIFLTVLNETDKMAVTTQIQTFFQNINSSTIDSGLALKNSIITNTVYVALIFILGISVIGILINIFLVYLKGFLVGFSVSAIISIYGFKGILAAFIYVFPHQILNAFAIIILAIYSVMFTSKMIKFILSEKNNNMKHVLKKYTIIFGITLSISLISSVSEAYILPAFMKLIIKLFI